MKIIASVTTTIKRIEKITNTLLSIINQTYCIDKIVVVIPYVSYITNETYIIPSSIYNLIPNIEIIRCDDCGPISKLLPLLSDINIDNDIWILTFDDDVIYHKDHLHNLLKSIGTISTNKVYGLSGFSINQDNNMITQVLEGNNTILYHRSIFRDDFKEYVDLLLNNINCRYSDDIIISNYLAKYNISMIICNINNYEMYQKYIVTYATTKDSLSNGKNGLILEKTMRYKRVIQILKDLDIYNL